MTEKLRSIIKYRVFIFNKSNEKVFNGNLLCPFSFGAHNWDQICYSRKMSQIFSYIPSLLIEFIEQVNLALCWLG